MVIFSCTPPPLNVGSGKFGTPFERMQAENFKACACCAALTVPPCPPPGCSDWQAFCAACICGELGSRSEPALALICSELPTGSGKSGTPCARMHSEYASNPAAPVGAGELLGAAEPAADGAALAAGVVSFATLGLAELLLHPVVTTARQTAATANNVARDRTSMAMLVFLLGGSSSCTGALVTPR